MRRVSLTTREVSRLRLGLRGESLRRCAVAVREESEQENTAVESDEFTAKGPEENEAIRSIGSLHSATKKR